LEIEIGEFAVIFGPSGCGKSTLLHCLLGLEEPTTGEVSIEGKKIYQFSEDERSRYRRHKVGVVYQQPLWISSFNVYKNISFPLYLKDDEEGIIDKKVKKALSLVCMEKSMNYMPTELSGGQQQKISLARSLVIDPILIIADEPTGNMDTVSGDELLQTFLRLQDQGKTIIMVTHDLSYLKYASKLFHMIDGEIVERQKIDRIKRKNQVFHQGGKNDVHDKDFLKKLKI